MSALRRAAAAGALLLLLASVASGADIPGRVDAAGLRRLVAEATAAGAVAVVSYWATWCGPCREEIPHLRALRREFPEEKLYLLGVSLDLDEASYLAFVRAHPFGYATAFGGEGLMEEKQVRAIPRTEVFAPDGTLRKVYDGQVNERLLRREIEALLRQGRGGRP